MSSAPDAVGIVLAFDHFFPERVVAHGGGSLFRQGVRIPACHSEDPSLGSPF
jgi:hypothetical protein